jgi:hypothetical protein
MGRTCCFAIGRGKSDKKTRKNQKTEIPEQLIKKRRFSQNEVFRGNHGEKRVNADTAGGSGQGLRVERIYETGANFYKRDCSKTSVFWKEKLYLSSFLEFKNLGIYLTQVTPF